MAMKWCDAQKHMYDAEAYDTCPFCEDEKLSTSSPAEPSSAGKTQMITSDDADSSTKTVMINSQNNPKTQPINPNNTMILTKSNSKEDLLPVAGWLVIIDGPGKGKDFRLIQGNNRIGRDKGMEVCLDLGSASDSAVSRDSHAIVVYDNNQNEFFIERGDSRNLPMLNGKTIRRDNDLVAGDIIEVGNTKLKFIPFCSEAFNW